MALRDDWHAEFRNGQLTNANFVCPHCQMAVTFQVLTQFLDPPNSDPTPGGVKIRYFAVLRCNYQPCRKFVYVITTKVRNATEQNYSADELITFPNYKITEPHAAIPREIAEDWVEAQRAFAESALKASAVMCRRVLYGVLLDRKCKEHPMRDGLKQLAEQERLPKVVEQWLDEIKEDGHDAAHPHRALQVPAENVAEVLEYTKELLRFVYIEPHELQERLARKATSTDTVP